MKVQMDINSYKAAFTGSAKQYNFYVNMVFPNLGNSLQAGVQGLIAGGLDSITGGLGSGLMGAASTMGILTTKGGVDGIDFMVRATQLPDSSFEEVSSSWMGHNYKMSGRQTYNDWVVTFNVDKNGKILKKFADWQKLMHDSETNTYGNPITYMTNPEVHLLGFDSGETVCVYKMYGAWPKLIGQVALDYSVGDVATVDITFSYQYHIVTETEPGVLASLASRGIKSFFQMGGADMLMEVVDSTTDSMTPGPLEYTDNSFLFDKKSVENLGYEATGNYEKNNPLGITNPGNDQMKYNMTKGVLPNDVFTSDQSLRYEKPSTTQTYSILDTNQSDHPEFQIGKYSMKSESNDLITYTLQPSYNGSSRTGYNVTYNITALGDAFTPTYIPMNLGNIEKIEVPSVFTPTVNNMITNIKQDPFYRLSDKIVKTYDSMVGKYNPTFANPIESARELFSWIKTGK